MRIEASYNIVTEMYLAGADKITAELRPASIKGALGFWYRALMYSRCKDWTEVKKREAELFGSTRTGQSKFLLRIAGVKPKAKKAGWDYKKSPSLAYLGYGLYNTNPRRDQCLGDGQRITFELILRSKDSLDAQDLLIVLKLLGLLGGLGSRSRRGFGSLSLQSLKKNGEEEWNPPKDEDALVQAIKDVVPTDFHNQGLPDYSAFSPHSRIIVLKKSKDAMTALQVIGSLLQNYRKDCKQDARRARAVIDGRVPDSHPERVAFGLPHNYFFKEDRLSIEIKGKHYQRRASPLFIHIHDLPEGACPILTLLPSRFFPQGEQIEMSSKGNKKQWVDCNITYDIINEFIACAINELGGMEVKR